MEQRGEAPQGPGWDAFQEWLRVALPRLYRHQIQTDPGNVDGLVGAVSRDTDSQLQGEEAAEDPVGLVHRVLGGSLVDSVRELQVSGPPSSDPAPTVDDETLAKIERVVATLPADEQETVGLYLQGFSRQEMELLMGWSDGEARSRVHQSIKALREWLQAVGVEYAAD